MQNPCDTTPAQKDLRHAERIANKLGKIENRQPELDHFFDHLKDTVLKTPEIIFSILHLILNDHAPDEEKENLPKIYQNLVLLLDEALTEMRYSVERGRPQSIEAADYLQTYLEKKVFQPHINLRIQKNILDAIYRSGLKLSPILKKRSNQVMEHHTHTQFGVKKKNEQLNHIFEAIVSDASESPFVLHDNLMSQLSMLSPKDLTDSIAFMLASNDRPIKAFGVLMLLHPEPAVRKEIPALFKQLDNYNSFMPEDLRRLIGIRNWLPTDEQPGIDDIIKKMRQARIECAPMPKPDPKIETYASSFDGSGGQGIWVVERAKGSKVLKK